MGVSSIHRVAAAAAILFALTFSSVQGYTSALNVNTRGGGCCHPQSSTTLRARGYKNTVRSSYTSTIHRRTNQLLQQLNDRNNNIPTYNHHHHCTQLNMARITIDDEKKTNDSKTKTKSSRSNNNKQSASTKKTTKKKKSAIIDQYFNLNSYVRSTTSTEAIGRRRKQQSLKISEDDTAEDEDTSIPPEVLRPFALLLLSQFILFIGVGAVIPTIPIYGQSIGLSSSANGIVISAPAVALLLISRTAGQTADVTRKSAMLSGMAIIALSDVGTALSTSLPTLLLARLGLGLGRGYAEAGERGMLTDLANRAPNLRGRALALQQACVALGIAVGAPLGGVVVESYGARSAFLCVSVAAVVALGIYAILPETVVVAGNKNKDGSSSIEQQEEGVADDDTDDANNNTSNNNNGAADWAQLLKTSSTWRSLAVAQSGTSFGFACKIAIIPVLANTYLGGATGAGLLLSAAGLAGLVGAPLGGFLADKAGSRVAAAVAGAASGVSLACIPLGLSLKGTTETVVPSSIMVPITEGLGGLSQEAMAFTILVLLWSVGASAQGPALTALAQEKAPIGSEATALGLPRAVGDGTYIVAPLILGYVSDVMDGRGLPGVACGVAGGAICLGSIALFLLGEEEED